MEYFKVRINPPEGMSSGVVVVEEFHPKWRSVIPKLYERGIERIMNEYAKRVSGWTGVPLVLEFSKEDGLKHIIFPPEAGLDLCLNPRPGYVSHNIVSPHAVMAVTAVIMEYLDHLNFALDELSSQ